MLVRATAAVAAPRRQIEAAEALPTSRPSRWSRLVSPPAKTCTRRAARDAKSASHRN